MTMRPKPPTIEKTTGLTTGADDATGFRVDADVPNADKVRTGKMSAAQMGDGNIAGTDVQWPPGRIENAPTARFGDVPIPEGIGE